MSVRWAVPGLMDPGTPRYDARKVQDWSSPCRLEFWSESAAEPEKGVEWWVSFGGSGALVGRQKGASSVFTQVADGQRVYGLEFGPRVLPPGTHQFEFSVGGGAIVRRYMSVPRTLANTVAPWALLRCAQPETGTPVVFERLVVWNAETNSFYYVGVSGDPAQITLEPQGTT